MLDIETLTAPREGEHDVQGIGGKTTGSGLGAVSPWRFNREFVLRHSQAALGGTGARGQQLTHEADRSAQPDGALVCDQTNCAGKTLHESSWVLALSPVGFDLRNWSSNLPASTRMRCKWPDWAQSANAQMCRLQETPNRVRHIQIPVDATRVPELHSGPLSSEGRTAVCRTSVHFGRVDMLLEPF